MTCGLRIVVVATACTIACSVTTAADHRQVFEQASANGKLANEGLRRCVRYMNAWLKHADPTTGLIPSRLYAGRYRQIWDPHNAGADNYPFMVLTAWFTDRDLFDGRMREMLRTEEKLTSRIGAMPDTYDFLRKQFSEADPDMTRIQFRSSEYVKDGLLPLTEWLGPSPWSERMINIVDDMWKHAPIDTPFGRIVSTDVEVNGEMLQVLSRLYWMTGEQRYLDYALRIGDYYLLGDHHPTRDTTMIKLRGHGEETISGLCELYATLHYTDPAKKATYEEPLHDMLDRILEVGRNEDGLFYNKVNPITGKLIDKNLSDCWGYVYNGFYTVYLIDGTQAYREAVLKALGALKGKYENYAWEGSSADGYADSIESALNLFNREAVDSTADWIDSETAVMWSKQQSSGVIEGWHGDGNFARTTLMVCLWKSQGLSVQPWREDVMLGAVRVNDELFITLSADEAWEGRLVFDTPRHRTTMKMPLDWPRLNQFPEWYVADPKTRYAFTNETARHEQMLSGVQLAEGVFVSVEAGQGSRLMVAPSEK